MPVFRRRAARPSGPAPGEGFAQVGRGAMVRGSLQGSGILIVHGELSGQVDLHGDLIVGQRGRLTFARVRALRLRVEGQAEGRLHIDGAVEVAEGGGLSGDVVARRLQTSPGSSLAGTLRIRTR